MVIQILSIQILKKNTLNDKIDQSEQILGGLPVICPTLVLIRFFLYIHQKMRPTVLEDTADFLSRTSFVKIISKLSCWTLNSSSKDRYPDIIKTTSFISSDKKHPYSVIMRFYRDLKYDGKFRSKCEESYKSNGQALSFSSKGYSV